MSLDAVRGRTAMVSTTKNMRELQEAYRLIVEVDPILQNKEVLKRFVWMASMEDSQPLQLGLFVKLEGGALYKVLEVKKSEVEPVESSGFGLFACCNFAKGEVVTIYVGKVIDKNVDSIYSITNSVVVLDAGPWCEGEDFATETYLGAHMANDAGWVEEGGDDDEEEEEDESNVYVSPRFEFVASKPIASGEEILYNYNLKESA